MRHLSLLIHLSNHLLNSIVSTCLDNFLCILDLGQVEPRVAGRWECLFYCKITDVPFFVGHDRYLHHKYFMLNSESKCSIAYFLQTKIFDFSLQYFNFRIGGKHIQHITVKV
jgi:hypothetical protein